MPPKMWQKKQKHIKQKGCLQCSIKPTTAKAQTSPSFCSQVIHHIYHSRTISFHISYAIKICRYICVGERWKGAREKCYLYGAQHMKDVYFLRFFVARLESTSCCFLSTCSIHPPSRILKQSFETCFFNPFYTQNEKSTAKKARGKNCFDWHQRPANKREEREKKKQNKNRCITGGRRGERVAPNTENNENNLKKTAEARWETAGRRGREMEREWKRE